MAKTTFSSQKTGLIANPSGSANDHLRNIRLAASLIKPSWFCTGFEVSQYVGHYPNPTKAVTQFRILSPDIVIRFGGQETVQIEKGGKLLMIIDGPMVQECYSILPAPFKDFGAKNNDPSAHWEIQKRSTVTSIALKALAKHMREAPVAYSFLRV